MKLKMQIFMFCFFFCFTAVPSFSQPPGMGIRGWRGEAPCWRASDLDLSREQRKNLEMIQQAYFRETQLLRAQLFTRRLELRELLIGPAIKIESIRAKNSEIIELQSKEEERSVDYLVKVRNLLTQEQLQKWCPEQEFPAFRHRMVGPGPMRPRNILPPPE